MKKKNYSKKRNNNKNVLDMSFRKDLIINANKIYTDEEFNNFICELKEQVKQLEAIQKKYYSSNFRIDNIYKRTFTDILHEKLNSIPMANKKNKRL